MSLTNDSSIQIGETDCTVNLIDHNCGYMTSPGRFGLHWKGT